MKIQHGGALDQAKLLFPHVKLPWIDLSTGINPYNYPISSIDLSLCKRLPLSSEEDQLRQIAANYYGCKNKSYVAIAPGTQLLISLMPFLLKAKEVYVLCPTYGEYFFSWQQAGVNVTKIYDIDHLIEYSQRENAVAILCNPNNPDGRQIISDKLTYIIEKWGKTGNYVILDEAYMDFIDKGLGYLLPKPGLIILRSFGKIFGLAGLRLGFILSSSEIIQKIRFMLGSWSVHGMAIQIAIKALQDDLWIQRTKSQLQIQQSRLDLLLTKASLHIIGGTLLFRLYSHPKARNIWKSLATQGIWVRQFDYNPAWLRFGLLYREEDWQRLEHALI